MLMAQTVMEAGTERVPEVGRGRGGGRQEPEVASSPQQGPGQRASSLGIINGAPHVHRVQAAVLCAAPVILACQSYQESEHSFTTRCAGAFDASRTPASSH